jgi:50S ribosomal subunit-associated GTPase HflX
VRDRTSELQRELKAVHREQVERRRHREGLPKVAIVGYTNAGKSSLMRAPVLRTREALRILKTGSRPKQSADL